MQTLIMKLFTSGSGREAGLLPRALVSLFRKLQGRLYGAMDLKPVMYQDVRQLDSGEIKVEEIRRNSLLKEVKDIFPHLKVNHTPAKNIKSLKKLMFYCSIVVC